MIKKIGEKYIYLFVCFFIITNISSCRIFSSSDNQNNGKVVNGFIEKGESTIILDEETINALNLNNTTSEGTAEFARASNQLNDINVGDILVSGPNDKMPYGILRKVISKNSRNSRLYIETEEASIEEAIKNAEINASKKISISEIKAFTPLKNGVELENNDRMNNRDTWTPEPLNFVLKDTVLFDLDKNPATTHDQIKANGKLSIEPAFDYDIKIGAFNLEKFMFINRTKQKAQLTISAGDVGTDTVVIDKKISLVDINSVPIEFTIAGFPIVVTPIIKVLVGIDGKAMVDVNLVFEEDLELKVGVEYNGTWKTVSDCLFKLKLNNSHINGSGRIRVYGSADLGLMFYGSVTPRAGFYPYIEAKSDGELNGDISFEAKTSNFKDFDTQVDSTIDGDLAWEVWSGFDVTAGIEAKILGKTIVNHSDIIYQKKMLLHKGELTTDPGSGEPICHKECWEEKHGCSTEEVCKTICN